MSRLQDLKRSGGYALPYGGEGWRHWHAGEKPRCPYPDCGRAFLDKIVEGRVVSTRPIGGRPDPDLVAPATCQKCGKKFEVAVPARLPAEPDLGRMEGTPSPV